MFDPTFEESAPGRDHDGVLTLADQAKLKDKKLLFVGVGLIGSNSVPHLADFGVGRIVLCDRAIVVTHNLNNQNFGGEHFGQAKAAALLRPLKRRHPKLHATSFDCPIEHLPIGIIAACDLVIGAVDNLGTRQYLNETVFRLGGMPYIDAGVGPNLLGRVDTFVAAGACLECCYGSKEFYRQLARETPCTPGGKAGVAPTRSPAALGAVIGAKVAVTAIRTLIGPQPTESRQLYFDLWHEKQNHSLLSRNQRCRFDHRVLHDRLELPTPYARAVLGDVLDVVRQRFGHDDVELQLRAGILESGKFGSDRFVNAGTLAPIARKTLPEFGLDEHDWIAAFPRGEGAEPCWIKFSAPDIAAASDRERQS